MTCLVYRIGYGGLFLERQKVLQIMAEALQRCGPKEGLVRTGSRVKLIREDQDGIEVQTEDGFVVRAEVVVGSDGVQKRRTRFHRLEPPEEQIQTDDCE